MKLYGQAGGVSSFFGSGTTLRMARKNRCNGSDFEVKDLYLMLFIYGILRVSGEYGRGCFGCRQRRS